MEAAEYIITGKEAAPGIAIGAALVYRPSLESHGFRPVEGQSRYIETGSATAEVKKLEEAIAAVDSSMAASMLRLQAEGKRAESHIFDSHRALLKNPTLLERATTLIVKAGWRAADAIVEAGEHQAAPLAETGDPYLKAYAADIRDVVGQVRRFLVRAKTLADRLHEPSIVVAEDLGLSEWMHIPREQLVGLALAAGGPTAHSIIMARSLGIPTILGLGSVLMKKVKDGTSLAFDGSVGQLVVQPTAETIAQMERRGRDLQKRQAFLFSQRELPPITRDGHRVALFANAATTVEAQTAREWGAEGIGSLRTEMLFLGRPSLPGEDEQVALYSAIAAELAGCPIVVRTLDIGGDKYLPSFPLPRETNPFLGWRGIRIGLSHPEDILLPQLRAMLRAGAEADVRIVLPMVTTVAEVRQVRALLERAHRELVAEGVACCAAPMLGVMVEIPAAALTADNLARECDFLSIGSNDLTQYALACDRTNQRVANLYQPLEPAVLRLMHLTIEAAHRANQKVSVCGEMASDPTMTALLIGMEVDELSCSPNALPLVRAAVRATCAERARLVAREVLAAACLEEVNERMHAYRRDEGVM
jgi:phosphoenolpyruvate-protein phosphotransferase